MFFEKKNKKKCSASSHSRYRNIRMLSRADYSVYTGNGYLSGEMRAFSALSARPRLIFIERFGDFQISPRLRRREGERGEKVEIGITCGGGKEGDNEVSEVKSAVSVK